MKASERPSGESRFRAPSVFRKKPSGWAIAKRMGLGFAGAKSTRGTNQVAIAQAPARGPSRRQRRSSLANVQAAIPAASAVQVRLVLENAQRSCPTEVSPSNARVPVSIS